MTCAPVEIRLAVEVLYKATALIEHSLVGNVPVRQNDGTLMFELDPDSEPKDIAMYCKANWRETNREIVRYLNASVRTFKDIFLACLHRATVNMYDSHRFPKCQFSAPGTHFSSGFLFWLCKRGLWAIGRATRRKCLSGYSPSRAILFLDGARVFDQCLPHDGHAPTAVPIASFHRGRCPLCTKATGLGKKSCSAARLGIDMFPPWEVARTCPEEPLGDLATAPRYTEISATQHLCSAFSAFRLSSEFCTRCAHGPGCCHGVAAQDCQFLSLGGPDASKVGTDSNLFMSMIADPVGKIAAVAVPQAFLLLSKPQPQHRPVNVGLFSYMAEPSPPAPNEG